MLKSTAEKTSNTPPVILPHLLQKTNKQKTCNSRNLKCEKRGKKKKKKKGGPNSQSTKISKTKLGGAWPGPLFSPVWLAMYLGRKPCLRWRPSTIKNRVRHLHYRRKASCQAYTTVNQKRGASLGVQWLRLCLLMQEVWGWSLVRKLRSHMLRSQKTKT